MKNLPLLASEGKIRKSLHSTVVSVLELMQKLGEICMNTVERDGSARTDAVIRQNFAGSARVVGTHRAGRGAGDAARAAAVFTTAAAVVLGAAGLANAAPSDQPGVTGPSQQQPGVTPEPRNEQAGVSTAPVPPPRPQQHSPLGDAIPDPQTYDPTEYRNPPSRSGGDYSGTGGTNSGYGGSQTRPAPSVVQDLPHLHAPEPVTPPKVIVPPAPDKLGLGDTTIPKPDWVPVDAAWKINGQIADMQRGTNAFLQSTGINAKRADLMSAAMVLGGVSGFAVGATTVGIPVAVVGAVGGGLIGGTIGGIAGAAMGTFIPVPVVGPITSGVAGTAIGAAAGAAVGAAALGVPAALAGGAVGAAIGAVGGAVATGGDGSDYTPPPPGSQAPPAPAPSLHDQVRAGADDAINSGEQAVNWVQSQPGGTQALDGAVSAGTTAADAVAAHPWALHAADEATQVARRVVDSAKAAPATAGVANAVSDVVAQQAPFAPGQFGPLTDAANGMLAAAERVVR
ncbi:hypothetical protein ACFYTQ_35435 [Nocardia sp. NPDC004068]|uniref:hypothetical protein n=1 Tax=Nocardia sp. NPDC004068 TaxID=3364303 RepID=UPI0036934B44